MKINYTMNSLSPYGGVRVLLEIMNGLSRRGHDIILTTSEPMENLTFPFHGKFNRAVSDYNVLIDKSLKLTYATIRKFQIPIPSSFFYRYLINLEKKNMPECDINVAHDFIGSIACYLSNKGLPFHHLQHFEEIMYKNDSQMMLYFRDVMNYPIYKIVNSLWLKRKMKEEFGLNLPKINPAINHSIFYPRAIHKKTQKKRVLCFARETRWKGFPEALKAMEIVMKERDNVEFMAYGAKKVSYSSPVAPYTFVRFPSDEELAKLYSSADIVICPSWYESFPLPPLEAMACGASVVTTKLGTEDYAFHKENSLVVPPKDPKALADAVIKLLQDKDLRRKFKEKGPQTAKKFTWEKTIDQVERIFKKNLNKS